MTPTLSLFVFALQLTVAIANLFSESIDIKLIEHTDIGCDCDSNWKSGGQICDSSRKICMDKEASCTTFSATVLPTVTTTTTVPCTATWKCTCNAERGADFQCLNGICVKFLSVVTSIPSSSAIRSRTSRTLQCNYNAECPADAKCKGGCCVKAAPVPVSTTTAMCPHATAPGIISPALKPSPSATKLACTCAVDCGDGFQYLNGVCIRLLPISKALWPPVPPLVPVIPPLFNPAPAQKPVCTCGAECGDSFQCLNEICVNTSTPFPPPKSASIKPIQPPTSMAACPPPAIISLVRKPAPSSACTYNADCGVGKCCNNGQCIKCAALHPIIRSTIVGIWIPCVLIE